MKKSSLRGSILLLLTATIWGIAFVAQSVGMDYVGPYTFNGVRNIIGACVLLPVIWVLDQVRAKDRSIDASEKVHFSWKQKELYVGGICCGIVLFIASTLQQIGILYTSVGKAGFITAMYIVLVPLFGIFLKKLIGLRIWISVAIAVVGLYLLCITEGFSIGKGDILVLLCAAAFSCHILVIDYFSPKVDGVRLSCLQFLVCGLISTAFMFVLEQPQLTLIFQAWMPILYAGVMSCGVAYTLQIVGQKDLNPTVASLIMSLESVVSVLAGWAILGQKLSIKELLGCILMFAAIILAQLPDKKQKTQM